MKKCVKCNIEKNLTEFIKQKRNKDGYRNDCKICAKEYFKEYYLKNLENIKTKTKEYQLNNLEKIKEYNFNNKVNRNNRDKKRKLENPLFKLRCNIRTRICSSIKNNGYTKKSVSHKILGCSFEKFKQHLEKQFTKGMTWENAGKWHLDHIYPVSLAKTEEELIKLNHYTNFQPLWAIDNIIKGNKI